MAEWELATGIGAKQDISASHRAALRVGTAQSVKGFLCSMRTEFDPPEPVLKVRGSDVSCNSNQHWETETRRSLGPAGQFILLNW